MIELKKALGNSSQIIDKSKWSTIPDPNFISPIIQKLKNFVSKDKNKSDEEDREAIDYN